MHGEMFIGWDDGECGVATSVVLLGDWRVR
jgi:hypothetical protein